jgi:hypothetical protein
MMIASRQALQLYEPIAVNPKRENAHKLIEIRLVDGTVFGRSRRLAKHQPTADEHGSFCDTRRKSTKQLGLSSVIIAHLQLQCHRASKMHKRTRKHTRNAMLLVPHVLDIAGNDCALTMQPTHVPR